MTPERLVSLMEILQIYAHQYVEKARRFELSKVKLVQNRSFWQDKEHRKMLLLELDQLADLCAANELPVTKVLIDHVRGSIKTVVANTEPEIAKGIAKHLNNRLLGRYLESITETLVNEMSTKVYFQLPYSRKEKFEQPLKDWELIIKRFGAVTRDVEEMKKCFALSRYTAAMFHAMQIAELGAIELGNHIGVTDLKKGWGPTQRKLEQLIKAGRTAFPATLGVTFDFLEQMNREIDSMTLSWRHKIDHAANRLAIIPNTDFTPDIAEHITGAVRVFMLRLQEGLP